MMRQAPIPNVWAKLESTEHLLHLARAFMTFFPTLFEDVQKKCDYTARVCYALISPTPRTHDWTQFPTGATNETDFATPRRIDELRQVLEHLHTSLGNMLVFVRVKFSATTDGHSLLLVKRNGEIATFQSFIGCAELDLYPGDMLTHFLANWDQNGDQPFVVTPKTFDIHCEVQPTFTCTEISFYVYRCDLA